MRTPGRTVIACLVLSFCSVVTSGAQAATRADDTSWGVLARGGYFGLPNSVADSFFHQHPDLDGSSYGGEIRYHGDEGGRGTSSIGLTIDSCQVKGKGIWQAEEDDVASTVDGKISLLSVTVTGYWSMFPSWYVHPYIGLGIGAGYLKGNYSENGVPVEVTGVIPVVHLPIGLAIELGERFQLSAEARFIDGLAYGGALQVRF